MAAFIQIGSKRSLRLIFAASVLLAIVVIARTLLTAYGLSFELPDLFARTEAPTPVATPAAPVSPPPANVVRGGHR